MAAIAVPIVPTEDALRAAMAAPDGAAKIVLDLYQLAAATARSLESHVGQSVLSHEDLESQNATLAQDLEEVKKIAEKALTTITGEVSRTQGIIEAQVARVDLAIGAADARSTDESATIKGVVDTQVQRINLELDQLKTAIAKEMSNVTSVAQLPADRGLQLVQLLVDPLNLRIDNPLDGL